MRSASKAMPESRDAASARVWARSHCRTMKIRKRRIWLAPTTACRIATAAMAHSTMSQPCCAGFVAARDRLCSADPETRQYWPAGSAEAMMSEIERESMEFDVVIVGAGPAGLAAAIRLKQINPELSVVVLEKGGGGRRAYPFRRRRRSDRHRPAAAGLARRARTIRSRRRSPTTISWCSDQSGSFRLPNFMMPPLMNNHGNYIVSLGNVCRWLADQGRGARRRDLSGLRRRRPDLRRRGQR